MSIPELRHKWGREHHTLDYLRMYDIDTIILGDLLDVAKFIVLPKNKFLIMQDSRPAGLYLLVDGMLQISQYDQSGGNDVLTVQNALSVVGDLELCCAECRHNTVSTVQAIYDSRAIFF